MSQKEMFRDLKSHEIECRVNTIKENGCSILLYKDARCDMNILDETVGAKDWQRVHEVINNVLYCGVSIWDDVKSQWITKYDAGTKSMTESEKGEASDSFKRACTNWGIGRELYTAPFIWITLEQGETYKKPKSEKYSLSPKVKFKVTEFEVTDGVITSVTISDGNRDRFSYPKGVYNKPTPPKPQTNQNGYVEQSKVLDAFRKVVPKNDDFIKDFLTQKQLKSNTIPKDRFKALTDGLKAEYKAYMELEATNDN